MLYHLPVLIVAVPLICAPLCLLIRRTFPVWLLTIAACTFSLAGTVEILTAALHGEVLRYDLGGWRPPWGIAYLVTAANASVALLVSLIFTGVAVYARHSIPRELAGGRSDVFFALFLLLLSGSSGVVLTNDLFNIFVFLEIASLSSYALVACSPGGRAPLAAFRYLIIGSLGASFFLLGIGFLYAMTGTLNLDDMSARLPSIIETRTGLAAFAFITAGLMLKIALFPLHTWLPDAYTEAPSAVSALLAGTSSKVSLYLLLILLFRLFGVHLTTHILPFDTILMILSSAAIVFGAVTAMGQKNVKRMMAYSSISQIGFIGLGIATASVAGITAAFIYLFSHALIKTGLFLALGCVIYHSGSSTFHSFAGIGRRMPWTAAAVVAGGLSLVGVPLTSGFISKWHLIGALFEARQWFLIGLVLAGSLLTLVYVWRLIECIYRNGTPEKTVREAPAALLIPVWLFIGLNLYLGVQAGSLVETARAAARALFGET